MTVEKSFVFRGMDVFYRTLGNPDNETLLFLHPAFTDHKVFIGQFRFFKEDYFIITVDLIGHGKNQKGRSKVTMGDLPEIINMIIIRENIEKCHVVGVSMGSLVAQGFADKYPGKVLSVTIVGGYSIHKENSEIKRGQGLEMIKWLGYILFSMKRFKNYIVNTSVKSDRGKAIFLEGARKFKRSSFLGMQGMDRIFRNMDEPAAYPLLIICGEFDRDIIKTASINLSKAEPSSKYIEIQGAGHCANIDNPDAFNEELSRFIKSI